MLQLPMDQYTSNNTQISEIRCTVFCNEELVNFPILYKAFLHFSALVDKFSNTECLLRDREVCPIIDLEEGFIVAEVGYIPLKTKNPKLFSVPTSPHGQKYAQEQFKLKRPYQHIMKIKVFTFTKNGTITPNLKSSHRQFVKAVEDNLSLCTKGIATIDTFKISDYLAAKYISELDFPKIEDSFKTMSRFKVDSTHKLI